ncbi:tyrosine-type recombinase/integrase [Enterococcus raffinosus]|uniref:Tyrosine-type recombinase/integrase n=1 Tax=Enterococcus raffinosus TaxID=71452 RepID=A0AAW8SXR4_9ENTE|nr:tyrosine-type recombinase/integrase [Enterococcus raffinosus]MDT2538256.1 tyrosine-type recombinase/integrase [Enterococcus raffinosus]
MARKRKELSGSVEDLGNGKYKLRIILGYNEKGNPKRTSKNVEAPNIRKAYRLLDDWIEDFETVGLTNIDLLTITFGQFVKNFWIKEASRNLEPKTFHNYNKHINNRFMNKFEYTSLVDIKPYMIKDIILNAKRINTKDPGRNSEKPLSRATKKQMLYAINSVFLIAQEEYGIIKDNPAQKVKIPKEKGVKKNVEEPYSEEEINKMISSAFGEDIEIKALILTAFITAARQGEIVALEEKDIDFDNKRIVFHQRISEVDGKSNVQLLPGLKNNDDSKIVSGPAYLFDVLKDLINHNKKIRWKLKVSRLDHYFIFDTKQDGTLPRGSYLYKKFKRFTKRHDLRHIRFHDIRHTSATYLLSNPEMTAKELQERLGHRDYNTTMNIYGHALKKQQDTATIAFDNLLKKDIK